MCGRGSLTKTERELEERFGSRFYAEDIARYKPLPNYNIAPTHYLPVITQEDPDRFTMHRWGLIPSWAKDPKIGSTMINARLEGLMDKPFYRRALERRRCLVPMDGFYEWKREGTRKQPYRIQVGTGELFAMAGLYDVWKSPEGEWVPSFTIITHAPNSFMAAIHDRMPAILLRDRERVWLDPKLDLEQLLRLLQPYPDTDMRAYAVSEAVNNVKNNSAVLIEPI